MNSGLASFWEVVGYDLGAFSPVHVFHADSDIGGHRQSDDVNVVTLFEHGLNFLQM